MSEHLEIELKFEVDSAAQLPAAWPSGLLAARQETFALSAAYYDTPARELAQRGLAVRKRSGGHDAGWHLKQRLAKNTQQEWQWAESAEMPAELAAKITQAVPSAAAQLVVIAQLNTIRRATVLTLGERQLYEIADDFVCAFDAEAGVSRGWREWEVEALTTDNELLPAIATALKAQGAVESLSDSKIARAVGALVPKAIIKAAPATQLAALQVLDLADRLQAEELAKNTAFTNFAAETGEQADFAAIFTAQHDSRVAELRQLAKELSSRSA